MSAAALRFGGGLCSVDCAASWDGSDAGGVSSACAGACASGCAASSPGIATRNCTDTASPHTRSSARSISGYMRCSSISDMNALGAPTLNTPSEYASPCVSLSQVSNAGRATCSWSSPSAASQRRSGLWWALFTRQSFRIGCEFGAARNTKRGWAHE